ncbi:endo-1,4-beta-xylanase 5-like [Pistacia vera]|uniref:endo-1,4-beta-xylanase 5-like n=1 Tax=Pistacia vera TaxID=55513 RepID=UPI001262B39F|nr:endo-1,4-beta-xylanase 5-like [Pistacia vera]
MSFGLKNNLSLLLLSLCTSLFAGCLSTIIIFALVAGFEASVLYDYTASIECLENPHKPQYDGGIITNPDLNLGLEGWSIFGNAKMEHRQLGGNKFLVCHSRNQPHDSISQKLYLQKDMHYTFSAWFQVSEGEVPVRAFIKTSSGSKFVGAVVAESKCWSMLKGGFTADESTPAELSFESNHTSIEIWVDSVSLQPFTREEWNSHQDQSIEKKHKRRVMLQAVDSRGNPLTNAKLSIEQKVSSRMPIGCATNKNILNNKKYQDWFTSRFGLTTFENEMKWYSTEPSQGKEDYSVADTMLQFMKKNRIAVRGHNIFWDDPKYQPGWLYSLSSSALRLAAEKRAKSIVTRYKGQLIAWDVINENLHFSFFENKMGADASIMAFKYANQYDPSTLMFMNDYNTIEEMGDQVSSPANYLKKLRQIQSSLSKGARVAIGLESHFRVPNIPYMRASIDKLAAAGVPIWLTEVDVEKGPNQALFLEQVLREGHSHPKVGGIVIWGAWSPQGCYRMCLTDNNFNNLPTGNVVDKLLNEWGRRKLQATTDDNGFFEASLSHGDYEVKVNHPIIKNPSLVHTFSIVPSRNSSTVLLRDSP